MTDSTPPDNPLDRSLCSNCGCPIKARIARVRCATCRSQVQA